VIVLPNAPVEVLLRGLSADAVPSTYSGGLDGDGVRALDAFVRTGGTLVCLDQSCALAIDVFNAMKDFGNDTAISFCPGPSVSMSTRLALAAACNAILPGSSRRAPRTGGVKRGVQAAVDTDKDLYDQRVAAGRGRDPGRSA
jgi:hypothetical protein